MAAYEKYQSATDPSQDRATFSQTLADRRADVVDKLQIRYTKFVEAGKNVVRRRLLVGEDSKHQRVNTGLAMLEIAADIRGLRRTMRHANDIQMALVCDPAATPAPAALLMLTLNSTSTTPLSPRLASTSLQEARARRIRWLRARTPTIGSWRLLWPRRTGMRLLSPVGRPQRTWRLTMRIKDRLACAWPAWPHAPSYIVDGSEVQGPSNGLNWQPPACDASARQVDDLNAFPLTFRSLSA